MKKIKCELFEIDFEDDFEDNLCQLYCSKLTGGVRTVLRVYCNSIWVIRTTFCSAAYSLVRGEHHGED